MLDSELHSALTSAFEFARRQPDPPKVPGDINAQRSCSFVTRLAAEFRERYPGPEYAVFSKDCADHRPTFKRNEFLFDIHVCEIGRVRHKDLPYVRRSIWQVESEFEADLREILIDFSKLVAGSAMQKLYIGSVERFLDELTVPARDCRSVVYAAFLPHPAKWTETAEGLRCIGLMATIGDR